MQCFTPRITFAQSSSSCWMLWRSPGSHSAAFTRIYPPCRSVPSFTPVGNPAPPAAFTISSLLPSGIFTYSSFCSSSGLMMIRSSSTSSTTPYALEKILAPRPVGVAIRVPFSTLSPAFTTGAQGAPTCWRSKICKFAMSLLFLSPLRRNLYLILSYAYLTIV